ncbi:unnamed protein product, partial [marine sediment metagenome]
HSGNLTDEGQFTKANAAQAKLTDIGTRPTTQVTPIMLLDSIFGRTLRFYNF